MVAAGPRPVRGQGAGSRALEGGWHLLVNSLAASRLVPRSVRWALYRAAGVRIASRAVMPTCFFGSRDVTIGRRTFLSYGCFVDGSAPVTIGDGCSFGMQVLLVTSTHDLAGPEQRAGDLVAAPISIGDGCWLGARAVVLPGVTIGPGCVIGAGAVVTKDCEPNGLYLGNPARRERELPSGT